MVRKKQLQNLVVVGLVLLTLLFGVFPILKRGGKDSTEIGGSPFGTYDVAVIGAEPEGIAAAVAAARAGMETVLITPEPGPASYMTECLINHVVPEEGRVDGLTVSLTGPVFRELYGGVESTFTEETYLRNALRVMVRESNLHVMYESTLTDFGQKGRRISSIRVFSDGELKDIGARVFLDATEEGILLEKLQIPGIPGASDLGAPDFYEPLSFNFRVRGISWDDIKTIAKVSEFSTELSEVLIAYPRLRDDMKLESPALIRQDGDDVLVTGIRAAFVDAGNPDAIEEAYRNCMREAMHLTAYLKTELMPFEDMEWDMAASRLHVPETIHYRGLTQLGVADLLENRDAPDKVAVLSGPATAGRFVRRDNPSILCNPDVYAVSIGCLVPEDWDNVMMLGSKAGFSSLASTSAGTVSARAVVGEGAGSAAAYCVLEGISPADVMKLSVARKREFVSFLERAGQPLPETGEPLRQQDGTPLASVWMYEDVKNLVVHGLLLGGENNDFRLDAGCTAEVLKVLANNALLRLAPDRFTLELDNRISLMPGSEPVTSEEASAILLVLAGQENAGLAGTAAERLFTWLEAGTDGVKVPDALRERWKSEVSAVNGELYHLVNRTCMKLTAGF